MQSFLPAPDSRIYQRPFYIEEDRGGFIGILPN